MRAEVCFACAEIFVQMRSSDSSLQFFTLRFCNFDSSGIQFGRMLDAFWTPFGGLLDTCWMPFGSWDVSGTNFDFFLNDFGNVSATKP